MGDRNLILAMSLGSTSTKIGLYRGQTEISRIGIDHPQAELAAFPNLRAQKDYRLAAINGFMATQGVSPKDLAAVVSRGGCLKPLPGGAYLVNDAMIEDLLSCRYGMHPCNLGASLAQQVAMAAGAPALVVDAPTTDELQPMARLSGLPGIERKASFHVLNQRAVGRRLANALGRKYEDLRLIGVHLGGGISVAAHDHGRLVDANNALDGDGPFSPQRAGGLPTSALIDLCFSGQYTRDEIYRQITTQGGLMGYLGTQDARKVQAMIAAGDARAALIYDGMAYQVAKEVGAMATVLGGAVDAIFLTGGLANSARLVDWLKARTSFIAPVYVFPGEDELQALAEGACSVVAGEFVPQVYPEDTILTA
jgi:butyrate kinase